MSQKVLYADYEDTASYLIPEGIDLKDTKNVCWYVRYNTLYIDTKDGKHFEIEGEIFLKSPERCRLYVYNKEEKEEYETDVDFNGSFDSSSEEESESESEEEEKPAERRPIDEAYLDYCVKERAQDRKPLDFVTWTDREFKRLTKIESKK